MALAPGATAVFQVTPTFSGEAFTPVITQAFVGSSDSVNFPVELVPTDPTGLTFKGTVNPELASAVSVSIAWGYHKPDGTLASVVDTVQLAPAITGAITGGTISQVS